MQRNFLQAMILKILAYRASLTARYRWFSIKKAGERAIGSVLASDAFFPFPDSIQAASQAGVVAIIQPGGSRRDDDVIAALRAYAQAMPSYDSVSRMPSTCLSAILAGDLRSRNADPAFVHDRAGALAVQSKVPDQAASRSASTSR